MKSCNTPETAGQIFELMERVDRTRALLEAVTSAASSLPASEELRAVTISVQTELARREDALERLMTGIAAAAVGNIARPARTRGGSVCGR